MLGQIRDARPVPGRRSPLARISCCACWQFHHGPQSFPSSNFNKCWRACKPYASVRWPPWFQWPPKSWRTTNPRWCGGETRRGPEVSGNSSRARLTWASISRLFSEASGGVGESAARRTRGRRSAGMAPAAAQHPERHWCRCTPASRAGWCRAETGRASAGPGEKPPTPSLRRPGHRRTDDASGDRPLSNDPRRWHFGQAAAGQKRAEVFIRSLRQHSSIHC